MIEWKKDELKKMKVVLGQLTKAKITTKNDTEISKEEKKEIKKYIKNLKPEQYSDEVKFKLRSLCNLVEYFYSESNKTYNYQKLEALNSLGEKTIAQIQSIARYLGRDLVYKIYNNSKKPYYLVKAMELNAREDNVKRNGVPKNKERTKD